MVKVVSVRFLMFCLVFLTMVYSKGAKCKDSRETCDEENGEFNLFDTTWHCLTSMIGARALWNYCPLKEYRFYIPDPESKLSFTRRCCYIGGRMRAFGSCDGFGKADDFFKMKDANGDEFCFYYKRLGIKEDWAKFTSGGSSSSEEKVDFGTGLVNEFEGTASDASSGLEDHLNLGEESSDSSTST